MNLIITEAEIEKAKESWGNALIEISITFEERGIEAARKLASDAIDSVRVWLWYWPSSIQTDDGEWRADISSYQRWSSGIFRWTQR